MGKDRTYEIDLLSLGEGQKHHYSYKIEKVFFEERENSDILGSDVEVEFDIENHHGNYHLAFRFRGVLDVACDRCLDPVAEDVDSEYEMTLRYGEEYDDSMDDLVVIPQSWSRYDVSAIIYDSLLLSLPMRCVHPDGECNSSMAAKLREHEADLSDDEN